MSLYEIQEEALTLKHNFLLQVDALQSRFVRVIRNNDVTKTND